MYTCRVRWRRCDVMLNDTATSSAVTSSRDDDVIRDATDDAVPAVGHDSTGSVSEMIVGGEYDVDMAAEYVDTSSVTSHAAGTDAVSRSQCRVCADDAAGMYFGALVCVPCKVCLLCQLGHGYLYNSRSRSPWIGLLRQSMKERTHHNLKIYQYTVVYWYIFKLGPDVSGATMQRLGRVQSWGIWAPEAESWWGSGGKAPEAEKNDINFVLGMMLPFLFLIYLVTFVMGFSHSYYISHLLNFKNFITFRDFSSERNIQMSWTCSSN